MRTRPTPVWMLLVLAGCMGNSLRFEAGTEPGVSTTLDLMEMTNGDARLTLSVHNPNDWPMTLTRAKIQVSGYVSAQNRPEYSGLQLEVPGRSTREVDIMMQLTDQERVAPEESDQERAPLPVSRQSRRIANVHGQLLFSTPQGTLAFQFKERQTA